MEEDTERRRRNEIVHQWTKHNQKEDKRFVIVLQGHAELDPMLNEEHPLHKLPKSNVVPKKEKGVPMTETVVVEEQKGEPATGKEPYRVTKNRLLELFCDFGYVGASKWSLDRLQVNIENLPKTVGKDVEPHTEGNKELTMELLQALEDKTPIEIITDSEVDPNPENNEPQRGYATQVEKERRQRSKERREKKYAMKESTKDQKPAKKTKPAKEEMMTEDTKEKRPRGRPRKESTAPTAPVKSSAKAEKGAKKPEKKQKPGPKPSTESNGDGRVTIVSTILECLEGGPVTKDKIVAKVNKAFPGRDEKTQRNTVVWNLSIGLPRKGYAVEKDEDGKFYLAGK